MLKLIIMFHNRMAGGTGTLRYLGQPERFFPLHDVTSFVVSPTSSWTTAGAWRCRFSTVDSLWDSNYNTKISISPDATWLWKQVPSEVEIKW